MPGSVLLTFGGTLGGQPIATCTASAAGLTGGTPTASVASTTAGVTATQTINVGAGVPLCWTLQSGYFANLISGNVTSINFTNAGTVATTVNLLIGQGT